MAITVTKESIDLGLVTGDTESMLGFYRDTLGLEVEGVVDMPGGATMTRVTCGTTVIKLVQPPRVPEAANPPGGIFGGTGIRYFTISVDDIEGAVADCAAAGYAIQVPVRESRPGVTIAIVEDPDGNWVEFLKRA